MRTSQDDCRVDGGGSKSRQCAFGKGITEGDSNYILSLEEVVARGSIKIREECSEPLNRAYFAAYARSEMKMLGAPSLELCCQDQLQHGEALALLQEYCLLGGKSASATRACSDVVTAVMAGTSLDAFL